MTGIVSLPTVKYKEDATQAAFYNSVEENLRRQPGVTDVAIADCVPFVDMCGSASFGIVGRTQAPNDPGPHGYIRSVSPGYFSTLKIPVVRGRAFNSMDRQGSAEVAVIDTVLAHQYWPNEDPIGQYLNFDKQHPKIQIVGVVAHARSSSLEADGSEGFYYLSLAQFPSSDVTVALRTSLSKTSPMGSVIQEAVRSADPNQPVYDLKTLQDRVEDSLLGRRFLVVLLSIFAGLALLLSALGLYGVINYGVKLRVREIGIRMALGAQRHAVLRVILRQGMQLAAVGLVLGAIGIFVVGRALSSMLFQVTLFNSATLFVTSIVLVATVMVATYLPARRAAQLDPMQTLRDE
jgi:predicted permease